MDVGMGGSGAIPAAGVPVPLAAFLLHLGRLGEPKAAGSWRGAQRCSHGAAGLAGG